MKRLLTIGLTTALLLTGCASGSKPSSVIKSADRKTAPKLFGATLDGSTYEMQKGKVTVINVWASWCAPCRAEAPILVDFAEKNPQMQFIGIVTRDNISAAKAFAARFKMTYPTFVDDALINKFQGSIPANGIPTTLVIDKSGHVAARISGATTVANFKRILEEVSGEQINA
jgi:thiol-disulfide isomerase/thioredoxin